MTTHRDHDRSISAWLVSEAPDRAPDDVLEASRERLRHTRQRRAWSPAWRYTPMNSYAKLAGAAAAVLVVGFVGYQLLPGTSGPGVPTSAPSNPTPAPVASPTPVPRIGSGVLTPGRYAWLAAPGGKVTFEVPAGWSGSRDGASIFKHEDQPGEIGIGEWTFDGFDVQHVYVDACRPPDTLSDIGPTADDLIAALEDQLSIDVVVTDVTVGGRPAKRVVLTEPDGLDRATCRHGVDGPLQIWADSIVDNYFSIAPETTGIAYVLEVGGERLVLQGGYKESASPADLAELEAIIASIAVEE
jgi:hypothetical protein